MCVYIYIYIYNRESISMAVCCTLPQSPRTVSRKLYYAVKVSLSEFPGVHFWCITQTRFRRKFLFPQVCFFFLSLSLTLSLLFSCPFLFRSEYCLLVYVPSLHSFIFHCLHSFFIHYIYYIAYFLVPILNKFFFAVIFRVTHVSF